MKLLNMNGLPKIIKLNKNVKIIDENDMGKKKLIMNDHHILPTAGHAGIQKTLHTIKQKYTWKGIDQDVKQMIKTCPHCQYFKNRTNSRIPMKITQSASEPMQKLYLDLVGPLVNSEGYEYILTTQCDFTKFITATPIKNKKTETVAKAFTENVILRYGIPETICTDRGKEFMSELFNNICKMLQIKKLNSTAYHHQSIGSLENSHKVLGNFLRIYCNNNPLLWIDWVSFYEFAYNTTVHISTSYTPFYLLYGRHPKLPSNVIEDAEEQISTTMNNYTEFLKAKLRIAHNIVKDKLTTNKQINKIIYDKNAKPAEYKKGEKVLLRNEAGKKLDSKYTGPYTVLKDCDENLEVKMGNRIETIHKNRVKRFYS